MKAIKFLLPIFIFSLLLFSCVSDKEEPTTSDIQEIIIEEAKEQLPDPVVEELSNEDLEYNRSVADLGVSVSKETFSEDKSEILAIIEKLSGIMKNKDYASWLNYLTPESKSFWSNQKNLELVSQRLPIKNYRLKNLQDYFEKVFIPSRLNRVVDEIRYLSPTKVKAVQYTEQQDIIYYFFEKIDGRWYLHLDTTV